MLSEQIKRTNTILYCKKWVATLEFYRDILELPINHETEWMVEFRLRDNTYLSIADEARTTIGSGGGEGITISWQVEDLDSVHRRLNALGAKTSKIKDVWGARAFTFYDPEGHRLEMWE
jgi:catechol 2,3-dioxygenase-like lactoylglutathione lyase family enzyme